MSSTHHGILIHVIFSTKWRKPWLKSAWREELFAYIGGTVKEHKAVLLSAGGVEDHVHLLLAIHPTFALADTMKLIKANSSRWINETKQPQLKFSWQRGYGAFSVSQSMSKVVKKYHAIQEEHHRTRTFEEEYVEFLKRHEIEYDPKYIFEQEHVA